MQTTNVEVNSTNGRTYTTTLQNLPMQCPICGVRMIPVFLEMSYSDKKGYTLFCRCTNTDCEGTFISKYKYVVLGNTARYDFSGIQQDVNLKKETFSADIEDISKAFIEIFNQAFAAQQMGLTDICGVGYRKALEFLIKDYIMSSMNDDAEKEKIKVKPLVACINDNISEIKIKEVAKRAAWLGNDETHYVRKWEDKDIHSLIATIRLTIHWIESEIETNRLLTEMENPK